MRNIILALFISLAFYNCSSPLDACAQVRKNNLYSCRANSIGTDYPACQNDNAEAYDVVAINSDRQVVYAVVCCVMMNGSMNCVMKNR